MLVMKYSSHWGGLCLNVQLLESELTQVSHSLMRAIKPTPPHLLVDGPSARASHAIWVSLLPPRSLLVALLCLTPEQQQQKPMGKLQ